MYMSELYREDDLPTLTDQQHVAATLLQSADPISRDVGILMRQRQAARRA